MKPFEVEILEKSIEQKGNMLKGCYDDDLFKSWSGDLQKRFPNGSWKTVNGAKVFVNGGKVVAGLDGFNGEIDKFFDSQKGDGDSYSTPKGKMSWGEIVDKYESDIKSLDSFFKKKNIDSKKIGRETIKGKVKLSNVSLGLNKEFRNEKEANEWINGEGKSLYEKEVEKRKEAYKEFKESPKSEGKGQDTAKEEKGVSLDNVAPTVDSLKKNRQDVILEIINRFGSENLQSKMRTVLSLTEEAERFKTHSSIGAIIDYVGDLSQNSNRKTSKIAEMAARAKDARGDILSEYNPVTKEYETPRGLR